MRIVVEQRGDRWLAQIVSVGGDLHWIEHRRIQYNLIDWVEKHTTHQVDIQGWQFYFHNTEDLTLFLLRWNDSN